MRTRSDQKSIAGGVCLLMAAVLLIGFFALIQPGNTQTEMPVRDGEIYAEADKAKILYQNEWYVLNEQLETCLVIGIDQILDGEENQKNTHRADFLALVIMDPAEASFRILHLNRDTMTEIPMLDIAGVPYDTRYAQLALAHTYGNNNDTRCRNTVSAVENLLCGIEIDHYISLTTDAVAILNDSVGGVPVTLLADFTHVNAAYTEGAAVTLTGSEALLYVQSRASRDDSSNVSRMERQQQYIGALLETYAKAENHKKTAMETILELHEYMVSDCTIHQLESFAEMMKAYTCAGIQTLPGETVSGEQFAEYHPEETAVKAAVMDLFYTREQDAKTIDGEEGRNGGETVPGC